MEVKDSYKLRQEMKRLKCIVFEVFYGAVCRSMQPPIRSVCLRKRVLIVSPQLLLTLPVSCLSVCLILCLPPCMSVCLSSIKQNITNTQMVHDTHCSLVAVSVLEKMIYILYTSRGRESVLSLVTSSDTLLMYGHLGVALQ